MKLAPALLLKIALLSAWMLLAVFITGCGSSSSLPTPPPPTGNTSVAVLISSIANDQLSQFNVGLSSLALTTDTGKTVSLFSTPQTPEFIHLNGTVEPLLMANIPQGTYTGASVTTNAYGGFVCASLLSSGGLVISHFGPGQFANVTLPSPIVVSGTAMGLLLELQVAQSATFSSCDLTGATYTTTPTFRLAPISISAQPTSLDSRNIDGLDGQMLSIGNGGGTFTMVTVEGVKLSLKTSGRTVYQGVGGFSALTAGMALDVGVAIEQDGSLLATRIAVEDTDPTNISLWTGPVLFVAASAPAMAYLPREQQGYLPSHNFGNQSYLSFGNAIFQTSGQFSNLQTLPFVPSFNATNMVAGQNVYVTSHAITTAPEPIYVQATSLTLIPQTIDGTVLGSSSDGDFSTYSVALAPYDLFPSLAAQPGQTSY